MKVLNGMGFDKSTLRNSRDIVLYVRARVTLLKRNATNKPLHFKPAHHLEDNLGESFSV